MRKIFDLLDVTDGESALKEVKKLQDKLDAAEKDAEKIKIDNLAAKDKEIEQLKTELEKLKQQLKESESEDFVNEAIKQGKLDARSADTFIRVFSRLERNEMEEFTKLIIESRQGLIEQAKQDFKDGKISAGQYQSELNRLNINIT